MSSSSADMTTILSYFKKAAKIEAPLQIKADGLKQRARQFNPMSKAESLDGQLITGKDSIKLSKEVGDALRVN